MPRFSEKIYLEIENVLKTVFVWFVAILLLTPMLARLLINYSCSYILITLRVVHTGSGSHTVSIQTNLINSGLWREYISQYNFTQIKKCFSSVMYRGVPH